MSTELSLRNYLAVLFDVDGTLVDSLGVIVRGLGDTFERYFGARPGDDELRARVGLPLRVLFARPDGQEPEPALLTEMTDYAIDRFERHQALERPIAPALEALRLCRVAGLKTALVTSKNARELELFLPRFSHSEFIDACVCASDVTNPKPDPESVRLACERLQVEPARTLMVGDSIFDIRAARAAGATPVAVAYGSTPRTRLEAESPALLLDRPEALLAWVQQSLLTTACPERSP